MKWEDARLIKIMIEGTMPNTQKVHAKFTISEDLKKEFHEVLLEYLSATEKQDSIVKAIVIDDAETNESCHLHISIIGIHLEQYINDFKIKLGRFNPHD